MQTFWELEKSNEVVDYHPAISAQETKQASKQINLLTLTVSCEKRSCLIRSKNIKWNQIKILIIIIIVIIKIIIIKREKRKEKNKLKNL